MLAVLDADAWAAWRIGPEEGRVMKRRTTAEEAVWDAWRRRSLVTGEHESLHALLR